MDARRTPKLMNNLEDTFKPVRHRDVKVQRISERGKDLSKELSKEFPGDSHIFRRMGSKMEEEGTQLIVVVDEYPEIDDEMWEDLKRFKNTKFLFALRAKKCQKVCSKLLSSGHNI